MTDSLEDLHKRLLAAQQELSIRRQLKQYDEDTQDDIISQIGLLELSVKQQIDAQLKRRVVIINIGEFHEQAKKIVLQRVIETFSHDMTIVDISPYPWSTCPTGYRYKRLKIGDIPGDMIAIEYIREMFGSNHGVFDGKRLFEHLR